MHAQECQYTSGCLCLPTVSTSNNDLFFPLGPGWIQMYGTAVYIYVFYTVQPQTHFYTVSAKKESLHDIKFIFRCIRAAFLKRKLLICSSLWLHHERNHDRWIITLIIRSNQARTLHSYGKEQSLHCRSQPAISNKIALLTGWLNFFLDICTQRENVRLLLCD